MYKLITLLVVYLAINGKVDASQETMKTMMLHYSKALDECKKERDLPDTIDVDFNNFWKEDYVVTNRLTGCAIDCLSRKLEILSPDGELHHGNIQDFAKKHGADDSMAKQISDILHMCGGNLPKDEPDKCIVVLAHAKCFKAEIHKLNWAPDMDIVVGGLLSDV